MRTLLSNAVNSCSILFVNGYEIDIDPVDSNAILIVRFPDDDSVALFYDVLIEIDSDSDARVTDNAGIQHVFSFKVTIPMRAQDLIKGGPGG